MIYVMSEKMYWGYISGSKERSPMSHDELISYLNKGRGFRGTISRLEIVQHA